MRWVLVGAIAISVGASSASLANIRTPLPIVATTLSPAPKGTAQWVRLPTGDDFARFYPPDALERGIAGHATMKCRFKSDGTLTDCDIVEETPRARGFGAATLRLAQKFQAAPTTDEGEAIEGITVTIPIGWRLK